MPPGQDCGIRGRGSERHGSQSPRRRAPISDNSISNICSRQPSRHRLIETPDSGAGVGPGSGLADLAEEHLSVPTDKGSRPCRKVSHFCAARLSGFPARGNTHDSRRRLRRPEQPVVPQARVPRRPQLLSRRGGCGERRGLHWPVWNCCTVEMRFVPSELVL